MTTACTATQPATAYLRMPDVQRVTRMSKPWVYLQIKENGFPKPIHLSKRAVVWIESEVIEWLQKRVSASREL